MLVAFALENTHSDNTAENYDDYDKTEMSRWEYFAKIDRAPQYVIATSTHGREFCSVLGRNGFWAVQFHPEKSGEPGLKLLKNFSAYCQENKHAQ